MFEVLGAAAQAWREVLYVSEWTGLSVGMLAALGALAYFFPPARTLAIVTGVSVAVGYGCLIYGNHTGRDDVLAEWTAANAKAKAAAAADDAGEQKTLDAKYLRPQAETPNQQVNVDESKVVGMVAGAASACQLGIDPLRLRKPK